MNAPEQAPAPLATAPPRGLALSTFTTAVTFDMPGATWDYVNALHAEYHFDERWPEGMLCHITGEVDRGVRSIGLWRTQALEQEYFRKVAVEVITASIQKLGPPPGADAGENFEPRPEGITGLLATDLCESFADIGPDDDGAAIAALGTQPVIATVDTSSEQSVFAGDLADGLIVAWTAVTSEGEVEHQVWASEDCAPAAAKSHPLKRISFGSSELR